MKCPLDGATLLMSEKHGIEIDYCPECRGIWLDRGEIEKMLEKSKLQESPASFPVQKSHDFPAQKVDFDDHKDHQYPHSQHKNKKNESWISDIFDF